MLVLARGMHNGLLLLLLLLLLGVGGCGLGDITRVGHVVVHVLGVVDGSFFMPWGHLFWFRVGCRKFSCIDHNTNAILLNKLSFACW